MFEELNYAELQEWKDELLKEAAGMSYDDPAFETVRKWINTVGEEMQYRESAAHRRLISVITVNVLVIVSMLSIVFMQSGCGTVEGLRRDIHNLTAPTRVQEK